MSLLRLHSEPMQDHWADAYGHLNEAYYLVPFSNATWKLQDHFGIGTDYFDATGRAIYTVETHLRYVSDVRAPATLEIESMILGCAAKKLWFAHQMRVDGTLRATAEFMALHYDTRESRTSEMPVDVIERLRAAQFADKPDWVGRSISLAGR